MAIEKTVKKDNKNSAEDRKIDIPSSWFIGVAHQGFAHIIERLGKYNRTQASGLYFLIPFIESVVRCWDTREQVMDIHPQKVITKDNTVVIVDAVVFYLIRDTHKATYQVSKLEEAIQHLTTSFIRAEIGSMQLRELISKRDEINQNLLIEVDRATDPWGVQITRVEIKNIELPSDLEQSMASQRKSEIDADVKRIQAESDREVSITRATAKRDTDLIAAESNKATSILQAEAAKEASILQAEAAKEAGILEAEQNREAAILEAEGKLALARAEAIATERITAAIQKGDASAINYFVARDYVKALRDMASAKNHKVIMMPLEAGSVLGALGGIGELIKEAFPAKSGGQAAANTEILQLLNNLQNNPPATELAATTDYATESAQAESAAKSALDKPPTETEAEAPLPQKVRFESEKNDKASVDANLEQQSKTERAFKSKAASDDAAKQKPASSSTPPDDEQGSTNE